MTSPVLALHLLESQFETITQHRCLCIERGRAAARRREGERGEKGVRMYVCVCVCVCVYVCVRERWRNTSDVKQCGRL